MISVSSPLLALMTSGQYQRADLYKLALINGTTLYLTSWQMPIVSNGNTYLPSRIAGDRKWKVALGLDTSSFSVTIGADVLNELEINGVPFRQAARGGLLSGATLEMDWAYLSGGVLVGALPRFFGSVGQVQVDRLGAKLTVNSPLKMLDLQVPSKIYGPRCRWTLGDSNCGVNLSSFAVAGEVFGSPAPTQNSFQCSLSSQPAGYFNLGVITFTSGQNQGLSRQVRSYTPLSITLATPLPFAPASGDTFTATPGCDHTLPALTTTVPIPGGGGAVDVPYAGSGFVNLGVVYADGPHAGQALLLVPPPHAPTIGQYANAGNVYTFAPGENGAGQRHVTISFVTNASNGNGTCQKVFNNLANFGGFPFIPQPEVQYS